MYTTNTFFFFFFSPSSFYNWSHLNTSFLNYWDFLDMSRWNLDHLRHKEMEYLKCKVSMSWVCSDPFVCQVQLPKNKIKEGFSQTHYGSTEAGREAYATFFHFPTANGSFTCTIIMTWVRHAFCFHLRHWNMQSNFYPPDWKMTSRV